MATCGMVIEAALGPNLGLEGPFPIRQTRLLRAAANASEPQDGSSVTAGPRAEGRPGHRAEHIVVGDYYQRRSPLPTPCSWNCLPRRSDRTVVQWLARFTRTSLPQMTGLELQGNPPLALTSQKMAGREHLTPIRPAPPANPQRVSPDATSDNSSFGPYRPLGGGEGHCPLWDGHIIDATLPLAGTCPQSPRCIHP
jgi:hypothetical protein